MLRLLLFSSSLCLIYGIKFPLSLPSTDSSCLWNQFACSKNKCIAKQWLCDGENDCEDGLDESVQICGKAAVWLSAGFPSSVSPSGTASPGKLVASYAGGETQSKGRFPESDQCVNYHVQG
uniref:Uncharacterized protein n=1 Tax=Oryzias latipes TaxID=8090 RepID=A0A3P9HC21_ORYLA